MPSLRRLGGLIGLAALALAPAARAQQAAPMHLSLTYDGRLIIKVLEMRFEEEIGQAGFGASAHLNSSGILAAFKRFDVDAHARGHTEGGLERPGSFGYVNHDGKRVRHLDVSWSDGQVMMNTTPPFSNLGDPPATLAQKLASADPLTQLVRITMSPTREGPCTGEHHFFDGKQYYSLDLTQSGQASLSDTAKGLGVVNPVRCVVRYHEIAGFKAKPPEKRNGGLRGPIMVTFGQLGQNGPWVIAQLVAQTPLGYADIGLRTAKVTGARPHG
jgi:hypothetical protein